MVKPDWFDLGDYPGNYSPEYWAFQILYRLELLEGLEYCKVDPELAKQTFLFAGLRAAIEYGQIQVVLTRQLFSE